MIKIINSKVYSTEKAEKIYSWTQSRYTGEYFCPYTKYEVDLYITKKGNYFIHGHNDYACKEFIEKFSIEEFKDLLLEIDNEKYIELFGQDLEDA